MTAPRAMPREAEGEAEREAEREKNQNGLAGLSGHRNSPRGVEGTGGLGLG